MVTRYFGGILLGAGGLTRAYTKGAKDALDTVGIARMSLWTLWLVPCTYPLFERMKLEIAACNGVVRDAEYGADITLTVAFPAGGAEAFAPRLRELSAGGLEMVAAGEEYLPGPGIRTSKTRRTGRCAAFFLQRSATVRVWMALMDPALARRKIV